jgi:hypothetical protein
VVGVAVVDMVVAEVAVATAEEEEEEEEAMSAGVAAAELILAAVVAVVAVDERPQPVAECAPPLRAARGLHRVRPLDFATRLTQRESHGRIRCGHRLSVSLVVVDNFALEPEFRVPATQESRAETPGLRDCELVPG